MKTIAWLVIFLLVFSGCTLVNVSVAPRTEPLEEKLLEGKGTPKILLVDLEGVITFREEKGPLNLSTRPSKVAFLREVFQKAGEDSDIAALIVRINSPGGSVAASDTIYHEIMSFKQKRKIPVFAYITEIGASGAYYVASASDRIIASPAAVTGSIGVIAMKISLEGLFSKIGVAGETYKSGPKKDFWSPFRPSTPEEKKMLQGLINSFYERFVSIVYANRQKLLTEPEVRSLADGRILAANEALEKKLIDRVAYLDEAIEMMKQELDLQQARLVTYARPETYKSNIYSEMPQQGPQVINLISINAEDLAFFSGVQFMYLWNP